MDTLEYKIKINLIKFIKKNKVEEVKDIIKRHNVSLVNWKDAKKEIDKHYGGLVYQTVSPFS